MTKEEVLKGLKAGKKLRCDRKDEPLLPWLLGHPDINNRLVQADDQYSYIVFWWDERVRSDDCNNGKHDECAKSPMIGICGCKCHDHLDELEGIEAYG